MTERIITDSNGRKHITNEPQLHPPQRTWVGLTDNEVVYLKMLGRDLEFVSMTALRRFARDIAQTLKEKNNV